MQTRRLDTHAQLQKPHDREWVETVLAFLRGFVQDGMNGDMFVRGDRDADSRTYVKGLMEDIKQDSEAIENG